MICCTHTQMRSRVPLPLSLVLAAVVSGVASLLMWFAPASNSQFGWILPAFAGIATLGSLQATIPARFHSAWATIALPVLLGAVVLIGFILASESSKPASGKSSSFLWMMPVLIACTTGTRQKRTISCGVSRALLAIAVVAGLVPVVVACWLVWNAIQQGTGPVYAFLPTSLYAACSWTATAMLIGWCVVLTMGFRPLPDGSIDSDTPYGDG